MKYLKITQSSHRDRIFLNLKAIGLGSKKISLEPHPNRPKYHLLDILKGLPLIFKFYTKNTRNPMKQKKQISDFFSILFLRQPSKRYLLLCMLFFWVTVNSVSAQGHFSSELKTFREWIEILSDEQEHMYKRHPDLLNIQKGAAIVLSAKINTQYKKNNLTKLGKKYVTAYLSFRDGKAQAMLEKWKTDACLHPEDQDYRYVIQAMATDPQTCSKNHPILKLFIKGYMQEKFTRKEIDSMRFFLAGNPKPHSCYDYALRFGYAKYKWGSLDWREIISPIYPFPVGATVPNFKAFSYDKILEKHPYNPNWYTFQGDAFLTPDYLKTYVHQFEGYTVKTIDEKKKLIPNLFYTQPEYEKCTTTLSELQKDKRPVLIFSHGAGDTFDMYYDMVQWNMLYPVFKERVAFYYFCPIGGVGDYIGQSFDAVGAEGIVVNSMISSTGAYYDLFVTPFHIRNNIVMRFPFFNRFPVLIDNSAGTIKTSLLPTQAYIYIDKEGTQCAPEANRTALLNNANQLVFKHKKVPRAQGYLWKYWLKLKRTIRFLKLMESVNWQYDAENKELKEFYKTHGDISFREYGRYTIKEGLVKTIDVTNHLLVVEGLNNMTDPQRAKIHHIEINARTRVGTRSNKIRQCSHSIEDIKAGDSISVVYKYKGESNDKIALTVYRYPSNDLNPAQRYFVNAKVTAVNAQAGTITAIMPKPDYPHDWVGYKHWEERIAQGAQEPSRDNKKYHIGKKLLLGTEEDRTFQLVLDDAVDFSIDGLTAGPKDTTHIHKGDDVIFSFFYDHINTKPLYPENVYVIKPLK